MRFWRQLRWQLLASHLVVVVTGVTILFLIMRLVMLERLSSLIQPQLRHLTAEQDSQAIAQALNTLLSSFQEVVLYALFLAAIGSIGAGLMTSLLLTRRILRPLYNIAQSSQRIADGRYDERVAVPESFELALVADNFNHMAQALADIEEQRVMLIGNVSHELRSPLAGIEGYLEGLMDGVFPDNNETFALMYQEVRRLRRLVDDLQTLSKVETGHISLRWETFPLTPLIQRLVDQLLPQALAQAMTITVDVPSEPVSIYADADRVAQILLNLLGNAIRYTPEGGQITVRLTSNKQVVQIQVIDTGLGIPLEALPYLFERFYRVDPSRSRSSGGSGIGLTISQHLAWAMGGELTAYSAGVGQGSTFTLSLPY